MRTLVEWRGISRQVINYAIEQRQSNQKWQTVFKRLFSSIKQAACLCEAVGLEENHTIKETPHVYTHIHMQLQHGPSCIVFCVMQHTLLFFFLFFTSVTKQPITNYTETQTWSVSNLLVTSCKEHGGASQNQTNQSTSKVETEWIYWQTQKWGAVMK